MIPERFVEPLQFAAQDLLGLLRAESGEDERLVQIGLMLFRQRLVYQIRFDGDRISAIVQDVTPAKVHLDLEFIHLSECSCPADGFCRHQLAVFFQLLSHAKSVTNWVEEWRQPIKEKNTAKQWGLQKAKDLLKTAGSLKPDYDRWTATFNESFDAIMEGQGDPKPFIIPELFQVYTRRWKAGAPFEQEWKLLYLLVGYVISFKKLMELSIKLGHTEDMIHRYYRHLFQTMMDEAVDVMNKLSVHSLPFAFDEFIVKLKDDSTGLLTIDFELEYERTHLYRLLWTNFFQKKDWCKKEIEKLEAIEPKTFPIIVGDLHLHILQRDDEMALRIVTVPEIAMTPYLLYWLDLFTSHKEWKRMGPYVEEFIKKLKDYLSIQEDYRAKASYMKLAIKAVAPFCSATGRPDLYEKVLIETLPYSYSEYEYTLFDNKSFDKWADLHAFMGYEIDMLHNDRIKALEKQDPAKLLPLYHHSIHDHISLRGRDHYREAVRKMKKLRTLYKKLKRQDDWELFLETLLEKTKRLRAFQEECKRGKLIDA
ncbi:SWIM zinc finger family protein [Bacillus sp. FJAT-29790]|nr:SWIM zinc finger family protein [Bacillus sp. FJAT-29790]